MRRHTATAFAALAMLVLPCSVRAVPRQRLVVVVEQASDAGLPEGAAEAAVGALTSKGYEVLSGPAVEAFIAKQGIEDLDGLTDRRAATLLQQFRADGLILVKVTIVLAERGRALGPRAQAALGMSAIGRRGDGAIRWRSARSVRADEAGAKKSLVQLAAERLFWSYPNPRSDPALVAVLAAKKRALRATQQVPRKLAGGPENIAALLEDNPELRTGPRFRLRMTRRLELPSPPPKTRPATPRIE